MEKLYTLPKLPYDYTSLAPYISEDQLTLHHTKHHQAYVTGANAIFEKFDKARKEKTDFDIKATAKELSFHIGGNSSTPCSGRTLPPQGKVAEECPEGELGKAIDADFGGFDRFKKEFSTAATSVEGSGWAALAYSNETGRLLIMQVEKHNVNGFPGHPILMVLDVWEHAYYLDYRNDRGKFVEAFWNIVNWDEVGKRLAAAMKK